MMKRCVFRKTAVIFLLIAAGAVAAVFFFKYKTRDGRSVKEGEYRCTISIRCDTILANMDRLDPEKKELIPADGALLPETEVSFDEGESAFDVLYRVARERKILMEFSDSPVYNAVYIEGIGNIYEFDCGELSGWVYSVNGVFPNYGMSYYKPKGGDKIEVMYSCDLGADVGNVFDSDLTKNGPRE